jgi:hypothetical protein
MSKKKVNPPRRKTMKCLARLQSAKRWLPTYQGKSILQGYKKWFGVNLHCAIQELKILGVKLDDNYIIQVIQSHEHMILARQKKNAEREQVKSDEELFESNDMFYYIAGYTSGGAPYGLTWEEAIEQGLHIDDDHF